MSTQEIYNRFLPPHKTKVERYDGQPLGPEAPRYSVWTANLVTVSDKVRDPRIRICDFGGAWLKSDPLKQDLQTPAMFLPPEATFAKDQLGFPADIWTLACSLYEIMGERPHFECVMPDVDYIIAEMNGRKDPEFSAAEIESLKKMLRAMLEYEPSKRATINQVVESDWMVRWGLPALRKFDKHG
ncbi:MAG: hypothetical protein Q9195_006013 [Heterodermia aff. obscurata]